jgi:RimJ/RimL family protein N-acetyltransferase
VPVPAKLPKGDWEAYRESVRNSEYYAKLMTPATAQEAAPEAGAQASVPAPTISTMPVVTTTAQPVVAAPAYTLPALPTDYTPFASLYKLLSAQRAPISTSAHAASSYADGIIRYWQLNQSVDEIDDDEPLTIIDLSAGDGQFSWQVMNALFEQMGALNLSLPPFRYIACVDNEQQMRTLNSHPYFNSAAQLDLFVATTLDALTTSDDDSLADNPCVVLAHGLFSRLQHDFLAVQDGELFGATAMVSGNPAPQERALELAFDWPPLSEFPLPEVATTVANMYREVLTNNIALLPSGALSLLDDIRRMTEGKFMLMSIDSAVAEEQDIRLGAFSPHSKVTVPLPCMPTNYHALSMYLRSMGAQVWHQRIPDSNQYFMVAAYDADEREIADGLPELLPPLTSAYSDEAQRFTKLVQRQLLTVPDCLSLLQRTNFDPLIVDEFYPILEGADWNAQSTSKSQWQLALARCWSQCLPRQNDAGFHLKISALAKNVGNFSLARECLEASIGYLGDNIDDLCHLADCFLRIGNTGEAQATLRKALAIQRLHPAANAAITEVERRLTNERQHTWFHSDLAAEEELRLEPLSSHHAEQYYKLYRDPQISELTMLPALNSLDMTKTWIASESAEIANTSCAVMHDSWGLIGFVCAQSNDDSGFFSFWIASEYQGQGYGKKAGNILMKMLNKNGIHNIFSSSFSDNQRSHRALKAIGFRALSTSAKDPYESLVFFHMGESGNQEHILEELEHLCSAFKIPYEFETATAEQV